jgi:hypothetical protein
MKGFSMVQALVNISEHANRILNIVKAKYGLRDKSQAIDAIAVEYEQELLEPELRPEFVEEVQALSRKGKFRKLKSVEELFK